MYFSVLNIKGSTYWSHNYSRTSANIKICTINFLNTVLIFSAMVDVSSLWEHLLSQRSGLIANMQFKGSVVTGKIQNVAVICTEETATVMACKRNIPTSSWS